jgi:hypothetical protein
LSHTFIVRRVDGDDKVDVAGYGSQHLQTINSEASEGYRVEARRAKTGKVARKSQTITPTGQIPIETHRDYPQSEARRHPERGVA